MMGPPTTGRSGREHARRHRSSLASEPDYLVDVLGQHAENASETGKEESVEHQRSSLRPPPARGAGRPRDRRHQGAHRHRGGHHHLPHRSRDRRGRAAQAAGAGGRTDWCESSFSGSGSRAWPPFGSAVFSVARPARRTSRATIRSSCRSPPNSRSPAGAKHSASQRNWPTSSWRATAIASPPPLTGWATSLIHVARAGHRPGGRCRPTRRTPSSTSSSCAPPTASGITDPHLVLRRATTATTSCWRASTAARVGRVAARPGRRHRGAPDHVDHLVSPPHHPGGPDRRARCRRTGCCRTCTSATTTWPCSRPAPAGLSHEPPTAQPAVHHRAWTATRSSRPTATPAATCATTASTWIRSIRDEFDALGSGVRQPVRRPDRSRRRARNWDSDRRNADLDAEGIAGEVLFPNTVPPFFPKGSLAAPPPADARRARIPLGRVAGPQSLAGRLLLCRRPERRAGVGQILLGDVDEAVAGVAPIAKLGLRGGVLLPVSPRHWRSPSFTPSTGSRSGRRARTQAWWSTITAATPARPPRTSGAAPSPCGCTRPTGGPTGSLWHLVFSGTFDRHPGPGPWCLPNRAPGWLPAALDSLDVAAARYGRARSAISRFAGPDRRPAASQAASEYWARQCYVGCQLHATRRVRRAPTGSALTGSCGAADYPHLEGTAPYTREALRHTFSGVPTGRGGGHGRRQRGRPSTASTSTPSHPWSIESARPWPRLPSRWRRVPADASSTVFEPDPIRTW